MGGPLRIVLGKNTFTLNTFSANGSYYKWITLNSAGKVTSIEFTNIYGIQSVNLIATLSGSILTSAESTIGTILASKETVSLNDYTSLNCHGSNAKVRGIFNTNSELNSISVNNMQSPTLLLLPVRYPSGLSVSAINVSSTEVPVWGYFSGLLISNHGNGSATIRLVNNTIYSGILIYTPPALATSVILVNKYASRRRKKK